MTELDDEKKFYERFWCLLNDKDLTRAVKKFGVAILRRSSVLEGFEAFIKTNNFSGNTCVEIGTLKGLTAIVLARYFNKVISIDTGAKYDALEIAEFLHIKNIEFIVVKDNAEKAAVIAALEFDAAYVDGNHAQDTETDFALVKRCGHVLFHEHWDAQPAVVNLVKRLSAKRQGAQTIVTQGKFALWTD